MPQEQSLHGYLLSGTGKALYLPLETPRSFYGLLAGGSAVQGIPKLPGQRLLAAKDDAPEKGVTHTLLRSIYQCECVKDNLII